ncbi:MAG: aminotransferase class V-fold PLP-dependent enzyme [Candidatus Bathyarchaeia archaeon]|nr:aminotransferase class V-fold PLP-dependent enzyme [Candidatus Bathyarchaeia archaeon]
MEDIEKIREQFPITKNKVFLNHAAQSPLPKPVADAVRKFVDEFSNFGITSIEWNDGGKPFFAKLINAKPEEIAFVENTSVGLNIAANVLHYPSGSKIVTTDLEYPSVVYPWLRKSLGVKVHYVKNVNGKILLKDVEKAVDDKTVAVAVSHVEYVNGFRHDLRALSEIAHEHGSYLIVDAIQSAGAMQIDVKRDDVDFLMSACYKWLLSPPGAGYLYVKEGLIEKFEPPFVGWASVKPEVFETIDLWDIWSLRLSETASRFEVGSPSFISLTGATEALKMLLNIGIEKIEGRILKLTDRLIEAVKNLRLKLQTPEETQYRSGIVNFKIDRPQEVVEKLSRKGIVVSARAHGIRVSPHFYNTKEEIDKLVEEIKQCG